MYSHSLCVAALAFIAGNRLMARNCAERRPIAPLPKWRLARVNQYIDAHMEEAIRLADLAKAAGLTKMHFAAQFRASVGMCPHEYLLRQRIRRAQTLLRDSGQRLVDVALSVGFQAQSHFTTVFRRYVGEFSTPLAPFTERPRRREHLRPFAPRERPLLSGARTPFSR